jgi:hypothetical protein
MSQSFLRKALLHPFYRKCRPREIRLPSRHCTAATWQSQDLNPSYLDLYITRLEGGSCGEGITGIGVREPELDQYSEGGEK